MKKRYNHIFIGIFVIISAIILYFNFDHMKENILQKQDGFDNLFYAVKDGQGNYYAITKSHKEVICFDSNNKFKYRIRGKNNYNRGFNYANDIIIDEKNDSLYILSTYFDSNGDYIEKEGIVRYSLSGKFMNSIYSIEYSEQDEISAQGKIKDIKLLNTGKMAIAYTCGNFIEVGTVSPKQADNVEKGDIHQIKFDYADKILLDISIDDGYKNIYFTTKKGNIYRYSLGTNELGLLYNGSKEGIFIPSEIKAYKGNDIYVKELIENRLIKFTNDKNGYSKVLDSSIGFKDFVGFSFSHKDEILINDNEKIIEGILLDDSYAMKKSIDRMDYGFFDKVFQLFLWLIAIIMTIMIAYMMIIVYKTINENDKKINRQVTIIIIMLAVTTYLIAKYFYDTMDARAIEYNYENLLSNLELASKIIDGDNINEIKTIDDFMSEPFNRLIENLNNSLTVNGNKDYKKYAGIFVMINGKMCQLTYQDMDSSFFTPLSYEYQQNELYLKAFNTGQIGKGITEDAEGHFQYVVGPLYDSQGNRVGILEIGIDLFAYDEANKALILNLILNLLTIMVILILVFVEITIFDNKVLENLNEKNFDTNTMADIKIGSIRFASVLLFSSIYLSSTFMPIYSKRLYTGLFNLPEHIVVAMPLIAETIFLVITTLAFGYIKTKLRLKDNIIIGGLIMIIGSILTANSYSSLTLLLSRIVAGIGFGLIYVAIKTYTVCGQKEIMESEIAAYTAGVFCGINVGGVVGSILAEKIGFANVFYVLSVMMGISCFASYFLLDSRSKSSSEVEPEKSDRMNLFRFLFDKDILKFYLLEFLPTAICGMFLLYFFPLYVDQQGYSPLIIGRAFLLNGLFSIYLGPPLTHLTSKYLGARKSLMLSSVLLSSAILLFAFNTGSIIVAFITLIIIGIVESFKENTETDYFISLDASHKLGASKSMGIYSMFECTGEALGPVVYALILLMSMDKGLTVLGGCLTLLIIIFAFTTNEKYDIKADKKNLDA